MFIVRDILRNTKTNEIQVYYQAKGGRVSTSPIAMDCYTREQDAKALIKRELVSFGMKALNDHQAIENNLWEHTYSIVDSTEAKNLYSEMEEAKDKLRLKCWELWDKEAEIEDEDDKHEIEQEIETEIARFCIVPKWYELSPNSSTLYHDFKRRYDGAKWLESIKPKDYTKETKQGWKIEATLHTKLDYIVVVYRPTTNDFAWGKCYDVKTGSWGYGHYDYKTYNEALEDAIKSLI